MKIFVTGGNGFIGSHLVPVLINRGHEVVCVVRDLVRSDRLAQMGAQLAPGDVTGRETLRAAMRGAEAVFHIAGRYALGRSDQAGMQAVNVDGARNTLELAVELGVPKIIHTSTVGVFGNTRGEIVDETYRAEKDAMGSEYERTKWAAHYEVAVPLQRKGAPIIIIQPGGVTGPGDASPHMGIIQFFLNRLPVMLGTKSGLTLAHVDDIAEGHALALEKGRPGESYILAGPALTYQQIFELCERLTGIPAPKIWLPGPVAGAMSQLARAAESLGAQLQFSSEALGLLADYTFWAAADKARRELGWRTRPVESTLRAALETAMNRRARSI